MKLLVLSASDLGAALSMRDAIETMKSVFAALWTGQARVKGLGQELEF